MRIRVRLRAPKEGPATVRRQKLPATAAIVLTLASPALALAASGASVAPRQPSAAERAATQRRVSELRRGYHHRLVLISRATRLARTRAHLAGNHAAGASRYQRRLTGWSTPRISGHVATLRHRVRVLRSTGGAPDVAIPPQLRAIAACESGSNPQAVSSNGAYRGLFQFDRGTWASVGGHGDPAAAPAAEQYRRAAVLYARAGSSPWPVCGR